MPLQISDKEYARRLAQIREEMSARGLDALYLTSSVRVFYATGYHYYATRPQGCLIPLDGEVTNFIPVMEKQRLSERWPQFTDIVTYFEYPVKNKPHEVIDILAQLFKDRGLDDKRIGIDGPPLITMPDFRPPSLSGKLPRMELIPAGDVIDDMMIVKSREEIGLIEEAAKWCNLAHGILHDYIEPGASELEVSSRASYEATALMLKALGPEYETYDAGTITPARAMFHAGRRSAYPHAYNWNRSLRVGDVIATNASARIGGYKNHIERSMILGEPTERQRRYFDLMLKAQDAAFESIKPYAKASEVHMTVRKVIRNEGYEPDALLLHRSGRGLGLSGYEPPTLIDGDDTVLRPGMVFHVEPGIYLPEYSFRHCDTIVVTDEGCRDLDCYPRDLESLIISI